MLLFGRFCLARELRILRPTPCLDGPASALQIMALLVTYAVDALFRTCSLVPDVPSGVPLLATENYWMRSGEAPCEAAPWQNGDLQDLHAAP